MNKAVFIDKDGTLVDDVPYNVDPRLVTFTEGAIEALQTLKQEGFKLILISNQSGVARGYFTVEALDLLVQTLRELLRKEGVDMDGFYFCPHHPDGRIPNYSTDCECRKPKPGMILSAAVEFNIDLAQSWMIGDILNDIEAGNKAGCKTILINNGNETEWNLSGRRIPTAIVTDMLQAVKRIIHEPEMV